RRRPSQGARLRAAAGRAGAADRSLLVAEPAVLSHPRDGSHCAGLRARAFFRGIRTHAPSGNPGLLPPEPSPAELGCCALLATSCCRMATTHEMVVQLRPESPPSGLGCCADEIHWSQRALRGCCGNGLRQESPPAGRGVLRPPDDILSLSRVVDHPWSTLR